MNIQHLHRLLKRQIKNSELLKNKTEKLTGFLGLVDDVYKSSDDDLLHLEHILEEISKELLKTNQALMLKRDTTNTQLEHIVNNVKSVIFQTDLEGNFKYLNKAWTDLTGIRIQDAIGENFRIFLKGDNRLEKKKLAILFSSNLPKYQNIFKYIDKKKREKWVELIVSFKKDNLGFYDSTIGTITDVTSIKRTEINLLKAYKTQDEFLSAVSHDIRPPLNADTGLSNILLIEDHAPEQTESLSGLKYSSEYLLGLVNNILDFNKIKAGKIQIEEKGFSIFNLLDAFKANFQFQAEEKDIEFTIKKDENIPNNLVGDSLRLSQVLNNLLSNAFKFTHSGSIILEINNLGQEGLTQSLRFKVIDTGIGIPLSKQDMIFEGFNKAEIHNSRKYGGIGLGLTICKNLLKMQNSVLEVISEANSGSMFWFDIGFKTTDQSKENTPSLIFGNSNYSRLELRVLIAEDNKLNILILEKLLVHWCINFKIAVNGKELLDEHDNNEYDIILMDLQMPIIDGYEATKKIRNFPDTRKSQIPIIAVTASAQIDIKEKVERYDMNGFLGKPFNPSKLYAILEFYTKTQTL